MAFSEDFVGTVDPHHSIAPFVAIWRVWYRDRLFSATVGGSTRVGLLLTDGMRRSIPDHGWR